MFAYMTEQEIVETADKVQAFLRDLCEGIQDFDEWLEDEKNAELWNDIKLQLQELGEAFMQIYSFDGICTRCGSRLGMDWKAHPRPWPSCPMGCDPCPF